MNSTACHTSCCIMIRLFAGLEESTSIKEFFRDVVWCKMLNSDTCNMLSVKHVPETTSAPAATGAQAADLPKTQLPKLPRWGGALLGTSASPGTALTVPATIALEEAFVKRGLPEAALSRAEAAPALAREIGPEPLAPGTPVVMVG